MYSHFVQKIISLSLIMKQWRYKPEQNADIPCLDLSLVFVCLLLCHLTNLCDFIFRRIFELSKVDHRKDYLLFIITPFLCLLYFFLFHYLIVILPYVFLFQCFNMQIHIYKDMCRKCIKSDYHLIKQLGLWSKLYLLLGFGKVAWAFLGKC